MGSFGEPSGHRPLMLTQFVRAAQRTTGGHLWRPAWTGLDWLGR